MHAIPPRSRLAAPVWLFPSAAGSGIMCVILGLAVLIGWHTHQVTLVQVQNTMAPMQYNTAICFLLAGTALTLWAMGRHQTTTRILAGLTLAISAVTMAEYLFHTDLGIDQWHVHIIQNSPHPGRMSPVSALCFMLAEVAMLLLDLRTAPRWRLSVAGALSSIVISISAVALIGYWIGLPGAYGWGEMARMALHTSFGVGILGTGLFIVAWQLARNPGERTPRWLPTAVTLGILTGTVVMYFALDSKQDAEIAQTVKAGTESAKNQISVRMEARVRSLVRMGRRWEYSPPTQAAWEADAANYVQDFPDLQALEWIDSAHLVRWVVPLAGNENKVNLDLTKETRRNVAVQKSERERQPVITQIVTLFRGGLGFVVYIPIVVHDKPQGFIAGVFNAQICLQRYLPSTVAAGEAIRLTAGKQIFFERDAEAPPVRENWVVEDQIELHGVTWDLRMWPTPALANRLDSPLPTIVLFAGALGALLGGAVCFLSQRYSREATATARANAALQVALAEVKTLEGLLPICSCCKRVRDDTGYWNQIDTYLYKHTNASLSHGYCPECAAKAFEEFGLEVPERVRAELASKNFE